MGDVTITIPTLVTQAKAVLELVGDEPMTIHTLDAYEIHDMLKGFVQGVPRLLAELDEAGETADYWRKRADELGTELDELRSAVRSLFTHGGRMVSPAPGTYRNLWSLVANTTETAEKTSVSAPEHESRRWKLSTPDLASQMRQLGRGAGRTTTKAVLVRPSVLHQAADEIDRLRAAARSAAEYLEDGRPVAALNHLLRALVAPSVPETGEAAP